MILALFAGAGVDGEDGFALEATRGNAWDGSLTDDGAEAVFCVH